MHPLKISKSIALSLFLYCGISFSAPSATESEQNPNLLFQRYLLEMESEIYEERIWAMKHLLDLSEDYPESVEFIESAFIEASSEDMKLQLAYLLEQLYRRQELSRSQVWSGLDLMLELLKIDGAEKPALRVYNSVEDLKHWRGRYIISIDDRDITNDEDVVEKAKDYLRSFSEGQSVNIVYVEKEPVRRNRLMGKKVALNVDPFVPAPVELIPDVAFKISNLSRDKIYLRKISEDRLESDKEQSRVDEKIRKKIRNLKLN